MSRTYIAIFQGVGRADNDGLEQRETSDDLLRTLRTTSVEADAADFVLGAIRNVPAESPLLSRIPRAGDIIVFIHSLNYCFLEKTTKHNNGIRYL